MTSNFHEPVLLKEVIEFLNCSSNGKYVDVTLGGGGWSEAILEASSPDGEVIAFDRDEDAIEEAEKRLEKFGDRFCTVHSRFSELESKLEAMGVNEVDGIVADLGVSSHQINEGDRGFSFMKPGELDMRMGRSEEVTAYQLVNSVGEKELADLIFEFGDERHSRRIAKAIVRERGNSPIETTDRLAGIVASAMRGKSKIHPATRTFQALRIAVNNELGELEVLLEAAPKVLRVGGRLVVVSYHSLEDRRVKHKFVELARMDAFQRVTKKAARPTEEEIKINRRARSARLRVLERVS